jgi:hypothetical protein
MESSVLPKDEIWFLRLCHHISNAVYLPGVGGGNKKEREHLEVVVVDGRSILKLIFKK